MLKMSQISIFLVVSTHIYPNDVCKSVDQQNLQGLEELKITLIFFSIERETKKEFESSVGTRASN